MAAANIPLNNIISKADVVLAAGVMSMLLIMVVPLPLIVLDLLLALSITVGIGLLLGLFCQSSSPTAPPPSHNLAPRAPSGPKRARPGYLDVAEPVTQLGLLFSELGVLGLYSQVLAR